MTDRKHELEIELDAGLLIDQARRVNEGQPNAYLELVQSFVDNVRVLVRKVGELT